MMGLSELSRTGPASDSSVLPASANKNINTRFVKGGAVVLNIQNTCVLTSDTGVAIFLLGIKSLLKPYVVIL